MKRDFLGLDSKDKMLVALISTSKAMTGRYPTNEELNDGVKNLNIELTDEDKIRLNETFPGINL